MALVQLFHLDYYLTKMNWRRFILSILIIYTVLPVLYFQVGPSTEMISHYETALGRFEEDETVNEESVSIQYEKVCRVV